MALPEVSLLDGDKEERENSVAQRSDHGRGRSGGRGGDHGGGCIGGCGGRCYTDGSGNTPCIIIGTNMKPNF